MEPLHVLIDEGMLLELLFGRPLPLRQGDRLWDLLLEGRVRGYVTDFTLAQVGRYALRCCDEAMAGIVFNQLCQILYCHEVDQTTMHMAMASQLPMPIAIQAAVVTQWRLNGVVTHRPLDYITGSWVDDVVVYTPDRLLEEFAPDSLVGHRTRLETQYQDETQSGQNDWFGHIELVEVVCDGDRHTATVRLQTPLGQTYQETCSGVGPVDAALQALTQAVSHYIPVDDVRMVHFCCMATTTDSAVSAVVLLERQMTVAPGRGLHHNVIRASTMAYLDALGYLLDLL